MSIFAKAKKARENKKGFTLVELIVVLVILAILAAVLVPTLLGWIDKAKEEKIYNNAEAAYVAAQGLADEAYGTGAAFADKVTVDEVAKLTDLDASKFSFTATPGTGTGKDAYIIKTFEYTETSGSTSITLTWDKSTGSWTKTA